jgi:succinylglutamate desuccinylase
MSDENLPIDKLTRVFVKIRDAKAELAAEFKKKDEELTSQMNEIKSAMLDYCKSQNVESVRTDAGLVYRTVRTRYWTSDWESMHAFIVENNLPQLLEKRLNQGAVKQLLEESPEMVPPGVNADSEYTITVRKK